MTLVADLPKPAPNPLAGLKLRLTPALPFIVPVSIIIAWQLASSAGLIGNRLMPAPVDVVRAFWEKTASGELAVDILASSQRAISGLLVGGTIGFLLGLANGI